MLNKVISEIRSKVKKVVSTCLGELYLANLQKVHMLCKIVYYAGIMLDTFFITHYGQNYAGIIDSSLTLVTGKGIIGV